MIEVLQTGSGDPLEFDVAVGDASGTSRYRVTMARKHAERLCGGCAPERCVEAAFRFLLDREPREAILRSFDVSVIPRYFPEFETRIADYLAR